MRFLRCRDRLRGLNLCGFGQHPGQSEGTETGSGATQQVTPGNGLLEMRNLKHPGQSRSHLIVLRVLVQKLRPRAASSHFS